MTETKQYGLIGEKLGHSFSPQIHSKLADYKYDLFELRPDELEDFLLHGRFDGLNVTMPYKRAVIPYCGKLTPQAKHIGSVNTIVRQPDGSLLGHNTDYDGFHYMLKSVGAVVAKKKALILGTGGASLTVETVLRDLGAREIVFISRRGPNNYQNLHLHSNAQIIVNATPVGMYPNTGVAPVDLSLFPRCEGVFDLVYNPAKTQLLLDAGKRGIPNVNGLGMLVAQAKAAAESFTGTKIPDSRVEEIAADMRRQTCNLLLVGMPGCGKSTVGRELAARLGRTMVDIDDMVEQQAGCTVPEIFARDGEERFRHMEHQALCQVSKMSSMVISTGDAIVTRPENLDPLAQNSTVIFLRRDLELLRVKGKTGVQKEGLKELYQERLSMYEGVADLVVDNVTVDGTVDEIMKRLSL